MAYLSLRLLDKKQYFFCLPKSKNPENGKKEKVIWIESTVED